jgi:hypothetical protein
MRWLLSSDSGPYNSWGNNPAMRASSIRFALNTANEVLEETKRSTEVIIQLGGTAVATQFAFHLPAKTKFEPVCCAWDGYDVLLNYHGFPSSCISVFAH